jgi:multidrug efflux pump subunit AcrA (membrane-fusion protein)
MPPTTDPRDAARVADAPRAEVPETNRTRRLVTRVLLVALPLLAVLAAWWLTRDSAPQVAAGGHDHATMAMGGDGARPVVLTAEQARRIGVTFAPVEVSDVPRRIRTVGQVTFDETRVTTISSKVDGWVERLHVDFTGRAVRRGEPLFALYSPMLVTAQEELLLAHRLARDVAAGGADARDGAEDLVTSARRRLTYWDVPEREIARVERTGQVERALTLTSPTSGVVIEKNVTQGQRVMAGDALYRVADLSTVWVEGDVYEQDLRAIRVGQLATAELDAYPGERWTGRIAYVYPTLAPETRTARVRVEIANPGRRLLPGMYATLYVEGAGAGSVITVPRSAVLATGERQIVFVKRADGRLEPRLVEVGATSDDRVEIVRGVSVGDTVVASATFLLDAESNLGTALGGMGDMPGMEFTLPPTGDSSPAAGPPGVTAPAPHAMPGTPTPAGPPSSRTPAAGAPLPARRPPASTPPPTPSGSGAPAGHGAHGGHDHDGAR